MVSLNGLSTQSDIYRHPYNTWYALQPYKDTHYIKQSITITIILKTHKKRKHKYYGQDEVKCGHVFIHFLHLGQNETTIGFLVVVSLVLSSCLASFSWSVSSKWKSLLSTLSCPSCPCSSFVFCMSCFISFKVFFNFLHS